jgi:hypothetical protein
MFHFPRILMLSAVIAAAPVARAQAPASDISRKIDELIQERLQKATIPASPRADDAEFLRRVYLDLTGRIPTYEQTTAFLSSTAPDKRTKLIDELLARPEYGQHFATIWRDLLVDRSMENSQVRQGFSWEFITWLADAFNKDRGWNEIVTAMLTAEGEAKKNPTTIFLLANRMNNFPRPADLASTTGRLFMGIQLRCAQCHDHPYVDAWSHDDFWGVAAFFGQLRDHGMEPDGNSRNPVFLDKPHPDAKKEIGYLNRLKRAGLIAPQDGAQIAIPNGSDPTKIARLVPAKFFLGEKPDVSGKPYRASFAAWLTAPANPYFARTAANRLWSHFFARGLAPVDDMRPDKTPSHPALLELLEKELKAAGFNQKHLIRAICNSQTYQRTSRPIKDNARDKELFSHMAIKLLSPDQMIDALAIAAGRATTVGKNRDQQSAPWVTAEADDDPTEFTHGLPQFLLRMNGGVANAGPPNLGKLTAGKSKEDAIRGLYLTVLSRPPRDAEMQRMLAHVEKATMANQGYRDVYWALLNSAEFVLNR